MVPERAHRPPAALPSTWPLRATAACRRWPRRAAAAPPACRGSVLRTWARTSPLRTSTGAWSITVTRGDASIKRAGNGRARVERGAAGRRVHHRNAQLGRIVQDVRAHGGGRCARRTRSSSSHHLVGILRRTGKENYDSCMSGEGLPLRNAYNPMPADGRWLAGSWPPHNQ